jgi:hypothetical protein
MIFRHPFLEDEGTSPHWVASKVLVAPLCCRLWRDGREDCSRQPVQQHRVGLFVVQTDDIRANDLGALQGPQKGRGKTGIEAGVQDALKGEFHGFGIEMDPVVKFDIFTQGGGVILIVLSP